MDFVIMKVLSRWEQLTIDQRFPVQDRQYCFAKSNVDEMKKDIERQNREENDHSHTIINYVAVASFSDRLIWFVKKEISD